MRLFRTRLVLLACIMAGCSDGTGPAPAPDVLTALPRSLTAQESSIIAASNAFTIQLFQRASAAEPGKNVFLSPLSASMALGMAMNGARNSTLESMRGALQFGQMPLADINNSYKSLIDLLTGLDPSLETVIANSIWYRNTLPINPAFVSTSKQFFNAEVTPLDFTAVNPSVKAVNDWVNTSTAGRIPTIIETISSDDAMFLVNAIYFKGKWRNGFPRSATKNATFTTGNGTTQSVPMMHLESGETVFRGGAWGDGTKTAELPYGNAAFNMEVYLPPDTSTVDRFVARLAPTDLMFGGGSPLASLSLWMPRVKLEYSRILNPDLVSLGMGVAFTAAADFGAMTTGDNPLAISDVLQKTFLSIDEDGTEAAAVTKVGVFVISLPAPLTMRVDRPYLILIRERLSGAILFIGKINTI